MLSPKKKDFCLFVSSQPKHIWFSEVKKFHEKVKGLTYGFYRILDHF